MLHYHALYVQCSQADTQVLCGKLHNSKDHDDSTIESRARAIAPHFPQFLTRQNNSKLQQAKREDNSHRRKPFTEPETKCKSLRATDCGRALVCSRSEEPSTLLGALHRQGEAHAAARSRATKVSRATASRRSHSSSLRRCRNLVSKTSPFAT